MDIHENFKYFPIVSKGIILLITIISISSIAKNHKKIIYISPETKSFIYISLIIFIVMTAAYYPGPIITDAMGAYKSLYTGTIDSYYGFFWDLILMLMYASFESFYFTSIAQYLIYILLSYKLINYSHSCNKVIKIIVAIIIFSPVFIIYAFYQHRDSAFALALFAYIIISNSLQDYKSIILSTLCCLIRPDFTIAYLIGALIYVFNKKNSRSPKKLILLCLTMMLPVVISVSFRSTADKFLLVEHSRSPYINTLLIQPLCAVTANESTSAVIKEADKNSIDRAYSITGLSNECSIKNIYIEWTKYNQFLSLKIEDKKTFYEASYNAILSNIPAVVARFIQIDLNANGLGPEMEGFMDVIKRDCLLCPEILRSKASYELRIKSIHDIIDKLFRYMETNGGWVRFILFNSWLTLLLLLCIHKWGFDDRIDAIIIMILIRYITLFGAPSSQYAYHFPLHLSTVALLYISCTQIMTKSNINIHMKA